MLWAVLSVITNDTWLSISLSEYLPPHAAERILSVAIANSFNDSFDSLREDGYHMDIILFSFSEKPAHNFKSER